MPRPCDGGPAANRGTAVEERACGAAIRTTYDQVLETAIDDRSLAPLLTCRRHLSARVCSSPVRPSKRCMLAVAARCLRLIPRRAPHAPPLLALRPLRPRTTRAPAPRALSASAMGSSDGEAPATTKAPDGGAAAAAAASAEAAPAAAKAPAKPRARKAPAAKAAAGDAGEGKDAEAEPKAKAPKKEKAEGEAKAVLPRADTPRKAPPAG